MTRDLTSDFLTELEASAVKIAFFLEAQFKSNPIYLWTGTGDITWDSKLWLGNGWFKGWAGAGETEDIKAVSVEVYLTGVPSSAISLALNESAQNKSGKIWFAFLDSSDGVIADPYLIFEGKFDHAVINDSPEEGGIVLVYESELIQLEEASEWRYNDVTQKYLFPGDRGFEYISSLAEWSGFWGVPERARNERANKPKRKARRRRR